MPSPFALIAKSLAENDKPRSWRESLRRRLPAERMHEILAELAEGKAWMAELPDGRCSAPVLPSSDIRLRAIMFLHEALHGKAVAQTEIQKAELEAKEFESIRALDDDALELEALKILEARKTNRLSSGPVTDAEFVPVDAIPLKGQALALSIWESVPTEEDDP